MAVKSSLERLARAIQSQIPRAIYSSYPTNNLLGMVQAKLPLQEFAQGLKVITTALEQQGLDLHQVLSKTVPINKDRMLKSRLFAALSKCHELLPDQFSGLKRTVTGRGLESVAFVCPEIGKWSTMGGLGVMVD